MFIYKITNIANGKVYVGKTASKRVEARWNRHKSSLRNNNHYNDHLQAAWNKDSESVFTFEVIEKFDPEMNFDLNNLERFWIKHYDSMNPEKGYNKSTGGEGTPGIVSHLRGKILPESTKVKMRNSHKQRRPISEETRLKLSLSKKGTKPTEETKRKMSEAQQIRFSKSNVWNKDKKGLQKAWNKGISPSEETRLKMSQARKGRVPWNKKQTNQNKEVN